MHSTEGLHPEPYELPPEVVGVLQELKGRRFLEAPYGERCTIYKHFPVLLFTVGQHLEGEFDPQPDIRKRATQHHLQDEVA